MGRGKAAATAVATAGDPHQRVADATELEKLMLSEKFDLHKFLCEPIPKSGVWCSSVSSGTMQMMSFHSAGLLRGKCERSSHDGRARSLERFIQLQDQR